MASHTKPASSIWTKPFILLKIGIAQIRTLLSFSLCLLPNTFVHKWPVLRTFIASFAYSEDSWVTFHENRYLVSTSGEAIEKWCKSAGVAHHVVSLPAESGMPSANLHWINCSPDDKGGVLLYYHGGGFCNPILADGHLPCCIEISRATKTPKIAVLEYGLGPELKYPGQLVQAISALRYVLKSHKPSEILVGGDSAGGNLTSAVLAHAIKPSPYAEPLVLNQKLRGALLISPWIKFGDAAQSFKSNARNDLCAPNMLKDFEVAFKPKIGDIYAEPVEALSDFWVDIPAAKTLVIGGIWELFIDDIRDLADKMGAKDLGVDAPVEKAYAEKECHIQCIIDKIAGYPNEQSKMMMLILDWCGRLP